MSEAINILGLMSGSSCDGLDAALCKFEFVNNKLEYSLLDKRAFPFPPDLKSGLQSAASLDTKSLFELQSKFSYFVADQINSFREGHSIDYIASHGHTVLHDPNNKYTLQIGDGAILANETYLPTICNFRAHDIAAGGQGAPLAPLADKYLFPGHSFYLNLGGISNISFENKGHTYGYDIGPCNQMLNALSAIEGLEFDKDGALSSSGVINDSLLNDLLGHEYFQRPYPKSLDNDWVKNNFSNPVTLFNDSVANRLRTSTEFIALTIKQDIEKLISGFDASVDCYTLFCTGGGVFNSFLMSRIEEHCKGINVDIIIPNQDIVEYKEAMLMGLMAFLKLKGKPNCIASVTGASKDCIGGVMYNP